MKTVFEKSQKGQHAYSLPQSNVAFDLYAPPSALLRKEPVGLPELSELDLTRHFTALASRSVGIDNCFYPLGSCTMKLNPRVNEWAAIQTEFSAIHPLAPDHLVQGSLAICVELAELLAELTGMAAASLNPNAGAQGEFCGVKMIAAYHKSRGDTQRVEMLIPDAAHGTNPITAKMAGFEVKTLRSDAEGDIDFAHLKELLSEKTAGLMLTNPNTLGLFSRNILEICQAVHEAGGLVFYDGANLNAVLELVRPGMMGFDVMHINLHKTFSTPHGGGGPGSGPICCSERLKPFLPTPHVAKKGEEKAGEKDGREGRQYETLWRTEESIGAISSFRGNFGIYLRAYLYAKLHGRYGLRRIAENAVLNANYLKSRLNALFTIPFQQPCMHEFVVQADRFLAKGVRALDLAKRLLDYGIYAPTIYFPLIVKECMLIEPTETESLATLDHFVEVMESIVKEIEEDPEIVLQAPHTRPVARLDEVRANRHPILSHHLNQESVAEIG